MFLHNGILGGRRCAKHFIHTKPVSSSRLLQEARYGSPAVRKPGNRELPETWTLPPMSEAQVRTSCSDSKYHSVQCTRDPQASQPLPNMKKHFKFNVCNLLKHTPFSLLWEIFQTLIIMNSICFLKIFTILSHLEMCMLSSTGFLTGKKTHANHRYILILIEHLCPTQSRGPKSTCACKFAQVSTFYISHL